MFVVALSCRGCLFCFLSLCGLVQLVNLRNLAIYFNTTGKNSEFVKYKNLEEMTKVLQSLVSLLLFVCSCQKKISDHLLVCGVSHLLSQQIYRQKGPLQNHDYVLLPLGGTLKVRERSFLSSPLLQLSLHPACLILYMST